MNQPLNILVVEDNDDDVFLLRQAFLKAGVGSRLYIVNDGLGALAYLQGQDEFANRLAHPFPDVLLLDINMPRMNGFEVLEWIRSDQRCPQLFVYVLTASPRSLDVQRAYDLGANAYLVKPSRIEDLVAFARALDEWHRFITPPQSAERTPHHAPFLLA